ncbi:Retrovirus-related Pol polyprotein from transposon TNT 1-94 [Senna tora]|uniref:Retrovirus-related Pol polyprotein from transposon TNT 1-94 n=1 Tax=Senna tora TaxID=362788 RepID=A0A834SHC2_9FABA|nr:Retrovirus-related Pol polyprotein from transposon TNT 1-94 [Senna tora]
MGDIHIGPWRSRKKGVHQNMQQMPREIVMNILSRLAWQELLERVRYVCRKWYSYIQHNDFAHLHMHRTPISSLVFIKYLAGVRFAIHVRRFHIRGHQRVREPNFEPDSQLKYNYYDVRLSSGKLSIDYNFIGSINGLISLHKLNTNTASVFNPLTKQMVALPPYDPHGCLSATGFGFCDVSKEYKLVHVYVVDDAILHRGDEVIRVEMMSMGVDRGWRKPRGRNGPSLLPVGSGVVVGNVIFWLGFLVRPNIPGEASWSKGVVWFDVSSEEFGVIGGCPDVGPNGCYNQKLIDKDGEVCLVSHCVPRRQKNKLIELVVWTLKRPLMARSKWVKQPRQYIKMRQHLRRRLSSAVCMTQGVYVVTYISDILQHASKIVLLRGQEEFPIFDFRKQGALVPCRLTLNSVAKRFSFKLAPRYYGPFRIVSRIGLVASKLELPQRSKIYPVFHVSLLKKFCRDKMDQVLPFPEDFDSAVSFSSLPKRIVAQRKARRGEEDGKVIFDGEGNDTHQSVALKSFVGPEAEVDTEKPKSSRIRRSGLKIMSWHEERMTEAISHSDLPFAEGVEVQHCRHFYRLWSSIGLGSSRIAFQPQIQEKLVNMNYSADRLFASKMSFTRRRLLGSLSTKFTFLREVSDVSLESLYDSINAICKWENESMESYLDGHRNKLLGEFKVVQEQWNPKDHQEQVENLQSILQPDHPVYLVNGSIFPLSFSNNIVYEQPLMFLGEKAIRKKDVKRIRLPGSWYKTFENHGPTDCQRFKELTTLMLSYPINVWFFDAVAGIQKKLLADLLKDENNFEIDLLEEPLPLKYKDRFKCFFFWNQLSCDMYGVVNALTEAEPVADAAQATKNFWLQANKVCRHTILSTLSNELFDIYSVYKEAKTIWELLILKHSAEDAGKQNFVVGNYYRWEMTDDKDIKSQINEYQRLLEELKAEKINLPDEFVAGILIEKLPDSWSDYKQQLKHKQKQLSLTDLITHIIIEDTNRKTIRIAKGKELTAKANLVDSRNKRYDSSNKHNKKTDYKPSSSNPKFKKKGNCFEDFEQAWQDAQETPDIFAESGCLPGKYLDM